MTEPRLVPDEQPPPAEQRQGGTVETCPGCPHKPHGVIRCREDGCECIYTRDFAPSPPPQITEEECPYIGCMATSIHTHASFQADRTVEGHPLSRRDGTRGGAMSDFAYVTSKPCGCILSICMIDDTSGADLRRHAEVRAAYNLGVGGVRRMCTDDARHLTFRCPDHPKIDPAAQPQKEQP